MTSVPGMSGKRNGGGGSTVVGRKRGKLTKITMEKRKKVNDIGGYNTPPSRACSRIPPMCVREERWLTRVTTRVVTNVNADVEPATEQNNTRTTTTERACVTITRDKSR